MDKDLLVLLMSGMILLGLLIAMRAIVYRGAKKCDGCGQPILPWQDERMYGNLGTGYPPSYYHRSCAPS